MNNTLQRMHSFHQLAGSYPITYHLGIYYTNQSLCNKQKPTSRTGIEVWGRGNGTEKSTQGLAM